MCEISYYSRPPVGFIVEGRGEFDSYPSILSKIIGASFLNLPRINARGNGGIIRRLHEHLADIVTTHKPVSVMVTVDLVDLIDQGVVSTCAELLEIILSDLEEWCKDNSSLPKYLPFPEKFSVVIQIPKFESWLIADKHSLWQYGYIRESDGEERWTNVDQQVRNPHQWFRDVSLESLDLKQPMICKEVAGCINIDVVKTVSPSFDKFYREVRKLYDHWQSKCGVAI